MSNLSQTNPRASQGGGISVQFIVYSVTEGTAQFTDTTTVAPLIQLDWDLVIVQV